MNGQISHLHHHYQLAIDARATGPTTARLERLLRERLANALDAALDQALGDDPTVYVLRQVDAQLALTLRGDLPDTQVVQRWAERLAGAIVRQIARTPNDGAKQMRFADQADYVTHYVIDLLGGRAEQQWYYHTFTRYRGQPAVAAVAAVLLDHRAELPAILRNLQERDALEPLLAKLPPATLQTLWRDGVGDQAGVEPAAVYPLFARTCALVDRLDLWRQTPPDAAALLPTYLAAGVAYVDWRDRTALTNQVIEVLNFLTRRGYLKLPKNEDAPHFLANIKQVLNDFDWLDIEQLRAALLTMRTAPATLEQQGRSANQNITPRQRALVNDLLKALTNASFRLELSQLDSMANRLRLYTLLIAAAPHWADDPLATGLIRQLLRVCNWLSQSASRGHLPDKVLWALRRGDIAEALHALPVASQAEAAGILNSLVALREPGLTLVERLLASRPVATNLSQQTPSLALSTRQPHISTALNLLAKLDEVSLALVLVAGAGDLFAQKGNTQQQLTEQVMRVLPAAHPQTAEALNRLIGMDESSRHLIGAFFRKELAGPAFDAAAQQLRPDQRTNLVAMIALLTQLDDTTLSFMQTLGRFDRSPAAVAQLLTVLPATNRAKVSAALQSLATLDEPSLRLVKELVRDTDPASAAAQQGIQTECAGVYLLLRAIADVQLPGLISRAYYPTGGEPSSLGAFLLALGLRWAGAPGVNAGEPELGLGLLAGGTPIQTLTDLWAAWMTMEPSAHARFQAALLQRLAGLRLLDGTVLHLHQLTLAGNQTALIAGDASGKLWPLGCLWDKARPMNTQPAVIMAAWLEDWQAATGHQPRIVLSADLAAELGDLPNVVTIQVAPSGGHPLRAIPPAGDAELASAYFAGRDALEAALAALDHGQLGWPEVDLTIALTAIALLRAWARWLPHFANSSIPYLLQHFIRRPGWVTLNDRTLLVELATMPLDMVLTLAGYTTTLEKVHWLDKRDIQFILRDG